MINDKSEISLKRKIASWLFILALISYLSYIVFGALIESYSEGIMERPYIWIGLFTWSIVGYHFYEIKLFLSKNNPFYRLLFVALCIFLYYLAMSGRFPAIFEFSIAVGVSPIVAILRGLIFEVILKKVE